MPVEGTSQQLFSLRLLGTKKTKNIERRRVKARKNIQKSHSKPMKVALQM